MGAASGGAIAFVLSLISIIVAEKAESKTLGNRNADVRSTGGAAKPYSDNPSATLSPTFEHEGLFIDVRRPPVEARRRQRKSVWRYLRSRAESIRQKKLKPI